MANVPRVVMLTMALRGQCIVTTGQRRGQCIRRGVTRLPRVFTTYQIVHASYNNRGVTLLSIKGLRVTIFVIPRVGFSARVIVERGTRLIRVVHRAMVTSVCFNDGPATELRAPLRQHLVIQVGLQFSSAGRRNVRDGVGVNVGWGEPVGPVVYFGQRYIFRRSTYPDTIVPTVRVGHNDQVV